MADADSVHEVKRRLADWEAGVVAHQPETKAVYQTDSGIPVKRLYTPVDLAETDYLTRIGFPGEFPYTRGPYQTMYRTRQWTMRQVSGLATGEETNARLKYLLSLGQTGLNIVFDMPTHRGYDSDHPIALGEVGQCGVAVDSLADMEQLFDGIPIEGVSSSLIANATAPILLAMYIALAESRGVPPEKLTGSIQNDVLKEYMGVGTSYIYPPAAALKMAVDVVEYCARRMPRWNTITINAHCLRENGISAVQEVGFALANAMTYIRAGVERGFSVDECAQRFSFHVAADNNFLEEVAKFRAMRRLWAQLLRDRFGARDPRTWMVRFSAQTAGRTLTAHEPENNIVRTAIQALAAVLGGVQSLHTNAMDEALGIPSEAAARIALRTQQIIGFETGVSDTVDPLGGSYCIESLTNAIEEKAAAIIDHIERLGGVPRAIEKGYFAGEIRRVNQEEDEAVRAGTKVVVGVNRFRMDAADTRDIEITKITPASEQVQIERVRGVRARRDARAAEQAVERVGAAAASGDNLMPALVDAVKAYATVGEIADTLRGVYGEYKELYAY